MINLSKKRILLGLIFVTLLSLFRFSVISSIASLETVQMRAHTLAQYVNAYYVYSVVIFLLVFICASAFFIPVTVLLSIVGGYLFGVWQGTLYAVAGATLGGCLTFLFVRYFISGFIQRKFQKQLVIFNREVDQYGPRYILMLQLLPASPSPLINVLAGVSRISLFQYIWTTALGILPGTFLFALAGTELHALDSTKNVMTLEAILIFSLLSGLILLSIFWRRLYRLVYPKNRQR